MIPFKPNNEKQYAKSLTGFRELASDWINTPHTEERIVPAWPLDLACGLLLLALPFFAQLN